MRALSPPTGLLVLALSLTGLAATTPPFPVRPDFSGRWVLDLGRSRLAPAFGDLTKGVVRIAHREPSFSFRRAFTRAGRLSTVSFSLRTDGVEVRGRDEGMPTRQSLTWKGDTLVFLTIFETARGEARNTVEYTLADDGRILHAHETFSGPRLGYDNRWVFTRTE